MLLNALKNQQEELQQACRQYGARRIRVFGSVARGEESADSDIDFLVELPRGYNLLTERLPLTRRLAEITGCRLDLIPEHLSSAALASRVGCSDLLSKRKTRMDRTKDTLAWLRTLFALLFVVEAPLAVWLAKNYNQASAGLLIAGFVVTVIFFGILAWIAVTAVRLLDRLGDTS